MLNGNQLNRVDDASTASAYDGGFEFKDAVKQNNEYVYDANGNLTQDLNKGIEDIQYNFLNLPRLVKFKDQSTITYTYAADGTKLRVEHKIGGSTTQTTYCSNVIYEGNAAKCLLTEEGYVALDNGEYYYYLKDHQGNNRVMVNKNGGVEEINHYYPFGGIFACEENVQPYKYNGKELDTKKGLNWYDYGARMYDAGLGRFTTMDPLAEKYREVSSYAYCLNNPIRNIDLKGDSVTVLNMGSENNQHLAMLIQNDAGKWQYYSVNGDNVYFSGQHIGGRTFNDAPALKEDGSPLLFDSPQQFMDSHYNSKGNKEDKTINSYGFTEGYIIPTSTEQDNKMRDTFSNISRNEDYDIITNNCASAVQRSLNMGGIETRSLHTVPGGKVFGGYKAIYSNSYIPSEAFKVIKINNPNGKYITKSK